MEVYRIGYINIKGIINTCSYYEYKKLIKTNAYK